jgi:hypothetical protein
MAVGPGERLGALELLDSARVFYQGPYRVVVVDDSGEIGTWRAVARYPEVDLLHNWRRRGLRHLVASLQRPYRHVARARRRALTRPRRSSLDAARAVALAQRTCMAFAACIVLVAADPDDIDRTKRDDNP